MVLRRDPLASRVFSVQPRFPVLIVIHFGVVHEDECPELSATKDWVPFEEMPADSLEQLELQRCPICDP